MESLWLRGAALLAVTNDHARASPGLAVTLAVAIFMGALQLVSWLARGGVRGDDDAVRGDDATRPRPSGTPTAHPPRARAAAARSGAAGGFQASPSLLDTHGTLLQSWKSPEVAPGSQCQPPAGATTEYAGWQNLLLVLLVYYLVSNALAHRHMGSIFADSGALVTQLTSHLGSYVRDCTLLTTCFVCWTWPLQVAISRGLGPLRHRSVQLAVQAITEAAFFFGCLHYSMHAAASADWPFLQRLFWMAQTVVFVMKQHSYLTVNRHLSVEVSLGGPGTGTYGDLSAGAPPPTSVAPLAAAATCAATTFTERLSRDAGCDEVAHAAIAGLASGTTMPIDDGHQPAAATVSLDGGGMPPRGGGGIETRLRSRRAAASDAAAAPAARAASATAAGAASAAAPVSAAAAASSVAPVATSAAVRYPMNVNLKDFLLFMCCPSLAYEPNFPRTASVRVGYVLEKLFMALGLLVAQGHVLSTYIAPALRRVGTVSTLDSVADLVLPMTAFGVLGFFTVFEAVLNASAELTRFADRRHYDAFWNSLSRGAALQVTLFTSIVVHELVLWGAFRRPLFPYLGLFSLTQLPLADLMRANGVRGRRLGNILFWSGLTSGVALLVVLYAQALQ